MRSVPLRGLWFLAGWVAVGIGAVGVVVPGLPTTVFFIVAAACFSRSSPRFERWVLGLPKVGPMVRDHRNGLGMPRRAKVWAVAAITVFAAAAAVVLRDRPVLAGGEVVVAVIGVGYVLWGVPTRERVLEQRSRRSPEQPAAGT